MNITQCMKEITDLTAGPAVEDFEAKVADIIERYTRTEKAALAAEVESAYRLLQEHGGGGKILEAAGLLARALAQQKQEG